MLAIYCRTSKESETSIEQQKELGIKFALENKLEYEVYEDEGISGYKISDDDLDPFNNRPSFTSMINDIKQKKITKVWVFEHSRLSRNSYASALIFNIFEKSKIELFENKTNLDLIDPEFQLKRQIMDTFSQYERHLIVNRTTRGLHKAMNAGTRGYSCFFGYEKIGFSEHGKMLWQPIESELNVIKYAYTRILKGISISLIARELFDNKMITNIKTMHRTIFMLSRYLSHFEYTGYTFNQEGKVIWRKILSGETISVHILNDPKYYITSKSYPEKLVSIDDWFTVFEKLVIIKANDSEKKKSGRKRAASTLATGMIKCSYCGMMFYTRRAYNGYKYYDYYKHISADTIGDRCKQTPKTFRIDNVDEMLKNFFFFNSIVYDNSISMIEESLFKIKQEIATINDEINSISGTIIKNDKNLIKFNKAHDATNDLDKMDFYFKRIKDTETKNELLIKEKSSLIVELDKLSIKYSGTELEKVYYNVKDLVLKFFNEYNNVEKRNHLIKIIKNCYAFGTYILIDTDSIIYLFDSKIKYKFDLTLLDNLNKDIIFKKYFISNAQKKSKTSIIPTPDSITYSNDGENFFIELDLKNKNDNYEAIEYLKSSGIDYDISKHDKVILSL